MPKITIDRSIGGLPTTTGTPQARGSFVSDALGRGLQSVGQAVSDVGQAIDTFQREKAKAKTIDYVTTTTVDVTDKADKIRESLEEQYTSNPDGYADAYTQQLDTLYGDAIQNAPTPEAKNQLTVQFANLRASKGVQARAWEESALAANFVENSQTNVNRLMNTLANDPLSEITVRSQLDQIVAGQQRFYNEKGFKQFQQNVERQFAQTKALSLGQAEINAGQSPEQALAYLKSEEITGQFSPSEIDRMQNSIIDYQESRKDAAIKAANEEVETNKNSFLTRIELQKTGANTDELPEVSMAEIFTSFQEGSSELTQVLKAYNSLRSNQTKTTDSIAFYQGVQVGARSVDPNDSQQLAQVQTYFDEVIKPQLDETQSIEEHIGIIDGFIETVGVYPPDMLDIEIGHLTNFDNPEAMIKSGRSLDAMISRHGKVAFQMGEKNKERAVMITSMSEVGMTPEQISEAMKASMMSDSDPRFVARKNEIQADPFEFNNEAKDKLLTAAGLTLTEEFVPFVELPVLPKEAELEMASLVESLRLTYGTDKDKAITNAAKLLGSTYGRSEINGEEQFTRYPVEKHFGVFGAKPEENTEWIKDQALEIANELIDEDVVAEDIFVSYSRGKSSGRTPGYDISYIDPLGFPRVITQGSVFRPNIELSEKAKALRLRVNQEAQQATISRLEGLQEVKQKEETKDVLLEIRESNIERRRGR